MSVLWLAHKCDLLHPGPPGSTQAFVRGPLFPREKNILWQLLPIYIGPVQQITKATGVIGRETLVEIATRQPQIPEIESICHGRNGERLRIERIFHNFVY